ncbi:MmcB family DNA repair protein [Hyphomicrobium sp.]|jgi:hypothetical protein|uniref:MmcB family DNA repair protein n=1 Tax=Hyphomicrobium sp. TaxID=82 RepID=UPI002C45DEBB|nr:MmcB family DNA repair protein [Hyphomicrobium sp.]HVZ05871.1 MmcB family DNA repair protein [Hyphomicrobium sp.]
MTDTPSSAMNHSLAASASIMRDDSQARAILRGTQRLLRALNFESLSEVCLANGRRADILALGPNGEAWIVEIKSSIADFRADQKWREYRDYCDALLFAVAPDFPADVLPADAGLILADAYAGEIVRAPPRHPLGPARKKALTLAFARTAASRLHGQSDPGAGIAMD